MEMPNNKTVNSLQIERIFNPHREAMLAALRLVLDLPQAPFVLEEEKK